MDLLTFTGFDDVRAVLGVSTDELEDSTLGLPVYAINLEAELREINASLPSAYEAVHAKPPTNFTEAERWFHETTRLFATYSVARQLCTSLPLFAPREVGDGKAHVTRFSADPYQATIAAVNDQYEVQRRRLDSAYAGVASTNSTATRRTYFAKSSSIDPVTGT